MIKFILNDITFVELEKFLKDNNIPLTKTFDVIFQDIDVNKLTVNFDNAIINQNNNK